MLQNATPVGREVVQSGAWLRLLSLAFLALAGSACSGDPSGPSTGSLAISVSGLPAGTEASVAVTGPGGFNRTVTGTETLGELALGGYTLTAASVTVQGAEYAPSPEHQSVNVTASSSPATATVTYHSVAAGAFNLSIDGMYLTQSVQSYTGGVPLVQGRNGYLRVFVVANQVNAAQPRVRVRLYLAGVDPVATYMISAPGLSVPTGVDES